MCPQLGLNQNELQILHRRTMISLKAIFSSTSLDGWMMIFNCGACPEKTHITAAASLAEISAVDLHSACLRACAVR